MKSLTRALQTLWCVAMVWSLVSLAAFRSSAEHGPDMVGQEVAGFVGPLVVAVVIGGVLAFVERGGNAQTFLRGSRALWGTVVAGAAEVLLYCTVVVR